MPSLPFVSTNISFRDENEESEDLPWISQEKSSTSSKHFNGFDQSLVDDVSELTKLVTTNMLKLDIEGKKAKYYFLFHSTK